jgi:hypothetical protein
MPSPPSTPAGWPAWRSPLRARAPSTPPFPPTRFEGLRALLHQCPRAFGRPTSLWTLGLAAEVSFERGLTAERVTRETARATLARLGVRWQLAKEWITSQGPAYARKKGRAIA